MKKSLFSSLCAVLFTGAAFAQNSDLRSEQVTPATSAKSEKAGEVRGGGGLNNTKSSRANSNPGTGAFGTSTAGNFTPTRVTEDKVEQVEIIAVGTASFVTSNTSDGTVNSYRHNPLISLALTPAGNKTGKYQLVFYPETAAIPEAASYANNVLSIYYPLSMFDAVKESLEKALAAKKKVFVKVVQKTDGYREGSLVF